MRLDTPNVLRHRKLHARTTTSTPPVELTPESFAARLYDSLAPLAQLDDVNEWALLIYCNALGAMFQLIESIVRDTPEGPGWSALVDLDRCPDVALPWLAQLVGVRLLPGSTPDEQRARIASTGGFRRGTRDAMIGAAQATLTGNGSVIFRERDHDSADTPDYAYYLTAITYADETPDPIATERALRAQKPGGLVLNFNVATGQTYDVVRLTNATYAEVSIDYASYGGLLVAEPNA